MKHMNIEADNLAECYLFILDRMRERKKSTVNRETLKHLHKKPLGVNQRGFPQPTRKVSNGKNHQTVTH